MRIAVYGGSFNPPHAGHALVAAWLGWTGRVDRVWLVPAFAHPFAKALAPFDRRLAMCRALAGTIGRHVEVCDVERDLPPPSYTVDTLRHLRTVYPSYTFRLVLGADNVPDLPQWREWSVISEEFSPIVVGRQGWPTPEGSIDFPGISSTEVRRRLAMGEPIDHLVPSAVRSLVDDLYCKSGPNPMNP